MLQPSKPMISPALVPMPTVKILMPRSAAMRAASSGSGPVVRWPSVSRITAAEPKEPGSTGVKGFFSFFSPGAGGIARWPVICDRSMPSSGNSVASDSTMPEPMAVPRWSWKRSIAATTSSRLKVGACTTAAVPANETTPMRTLRGNPATKALAASCEAISRLGCTSVARMLPETSIAKTMVSCCDGSFSRAIGLALASSSTATASSSSAGGRWRRQPGPLPMACLTRATLAKRTAFLRRRFSSHR